jgi:hypothetical protein
MRVLVLRFLWGQCCDQFSRIVCEDGDERKHLGQVIAKRFVFLQFSTEVKSNIFWLIPLRRRNPQKHFLQMVGRVKAVRTLHTKVGM